MAMQFDVKSTRRTTAGSIYGDRTRVKGIYVLLQLVQQQH
jgi:putative protein kinase ArgK-like GTPase of G3E family